MEKNKIGLNKIKEIFANERSSLFAFFAIKKNILDTIITKTITKLVKLIKVLLNLLISLLIRLDYQCITNIN